MRSAIRAGRRSALAVLIGGSAALAQAPPATDTTSEMQAVRAARATFAEVERDRATYRRVERTVLGLSTEGAEVVGLYCGDELRAIEATYFGETGRVVERTYFAGGGPVFIYRDYHVYDQPFGRVVAHNEDRFYFAGGELRRWIDHEGKHVPSGSAEFAAAAREQLEGLRPLLRALASPDSTYEVERDGDP